MKSHNDMEHVNQLSKLNYLSLMIKCRTKFMLVSQGNFHCNITNKPITIAKLHIITTNVAKFSVIPKHCWWEGGPPSLHWWHIWNYRIGPEGVGCDHMIVWMQDKWTTPWTNSRWVQWVCMVPNKVEDVWQLKWPAGTHLVLKWQLTSLACKVSQPDSFSLLANPMHLLWLN